MLRPSLLLFIVTLGGAATLAISTHGLAGVTAPPNSVGIQKTEAQQPRDALRLDFNQQAPGRLTASALRVRAQALESVILSERSQVIRDGHSNQVLRVEYPPAAAGARESGAAFIAKIAPAVEYYLSYRLRFEEGFDFVKGGKLPGLSSGGGKYTGGRIPRDGDGWSARMVWGRKGDASVYLYHAGMTGPWGDTLPLRANFQPGRWHTLVQRIRVNSPDKADGILQVWLDGTLRLSRDDLRFRIGNQGLVDSLCFSTFHGGHTADFAPSKVSYASFDDFSVTALPPEGLQP